MFRKIFVVSLLTVLVMNMAGATMIDLVVKPGFKADTTQTTSGMVYGIGLNLLTESGLGFELGAGTSTLVGINGNTDITMTPITAILKYALSGAQNVHPYIGYGLLYPAGLATPFTGSRGVAGFIFEVGPSLSLVLEGSYDTLASGSTNLSGWGGSIGIAFAIARPEREHGRREPEKLNPPEPLPNRPGPDRPGPNRPIDRPGNDPYIPGPR